MIKFTATILRFGQNGDKTGWTYIEIPAALAAELKPGNKRSFRVKGKLDSFKISFIAILPSGNGNFILPINAEMRKGTGKKQGAMLSVELQEDKKQFVINADLVTCLADEPAALRFFESLTPSHQRYFSKYIDDAKTAGTKARRIAMAVTALARSMDYGQMLREAKKERGV